MENTSISMKFSQFITEARTAAGEVAAKRGLQHAGHGYYADRQGNIVAKSEGGNRLVPVDAKEAEQAKINSDQGAAEDEHINSGEGLGTIALTFGRFNPPTVGHEKLLNTVSEQGADNYRIYPSRTVDPKKNPLEPDVKIDFMTRMFPNHADAIVNDGDMSNIFNVLSNLNQEGYSGVTMVVGSDRVSEFKSLLEKYNGQAYDFEELNVISAGERDPDAEGVEGMSASKLRAMAAAGDLEGFTQGVPGGDVKLAEQLMMEVRAGMGIVEQEQEEVAELWDIAPKLDAENLREAFFEDKVFPMGCIVEHLDTGIRGTVIRRGTNYVIFETPEHFKFNVWLTSIMEVKELHKSADDGSGNTWKVGTDTYRHAVQAMTPGQLVKKFSDFRKTGSTK
tara:strand:- start:3828 stop:5006 length:1179 start_codon:yes stop_codon:yes gene_type:complete